MAPWGLLAELAPGPGFGDFGDFGDFGAPRAPPRNPENPEKPRKSSSGPAKNEGRPRKFIFRANCPKTSLK